MKTRILHPPKGFTLIEALVFLFIFSVITLTFYQTWSLGTHYILNAKQRLAATALADRRMEAIRGMNYDDIGTTTGIPAGIIPENESVAGNSMVLSVHTFVQYVDDDFDGVAGSGDTIPTDYKRVRIEVSWGGGGTGNSVVIVSNFSPEGIETASNTGVLSVNVLNAAGDSIAGATVRVTNPSAGIDITTGTDALGNVLLPGAPPGTQNYHVAVSKAGYYAGQTYPAYPATSFDPIDADVSVVVGGLTQKSIVVDQSSDIRIETRDPLGNAIPNYDFRLVGGRQLGTVHEVIPLEPVYGYDANIATDGSGNLSLPAESYGIYTVTPDAGETGYRYIKAFPETTDQKAFDVAATTDPTVTILLADKLIPALLVTVKNAAGSSVLAGASVRLQNPTLGYDETVVTDSFGYAYFPTSGAGLVAGDYDYEVTLAGYDTESGTVTIGTELEESTINLNAS